MKVEDISGKRPIDLHLGDEALRLVAAEKIVEFDEEYNLKLRKKLVRFQYSCFTPVFLLVRIGLYLLSVP